MAHYLRIFELLGESSGIPYSCDNDEELLRFIFSASREINYEVLKLLVENGLDCNTRDDNGATPFHHALQSQPLPIIKLLLDHGADISAVNGRGESALHFATCNPNVDVLEFILDQAFDIETADNYSGTALHYAAEHVNAEACELLLSRGAAVNKGRRLYDVGHPNMDPAIALREATTLVIAIRLFPTHRTGAERHAFVANQVKTVRVLLQYGADIAAEYGFFYSALELAASDSASDGLRMVLIQHVARMEYQNLEISRRDRTTIEENEFYNRYYLTCCEELENMKDTKVHGDVSIFNILMDSDKIRPGYAGNGELMDALDKIDCYKRFPIYFAWLQKQFFKYRVRRGAAMVLSDIFMLNDPPHLVNRKILCYLSDADLKYLYPNSF